MYCYYWYLCNCFPCIKTTIQYLGLLCFRFGNIQVLRSCHNYVFPCLPLPTIMASRNLRQQKCHFEICWHDSGMLFILTYYITHYIILLIILIITVIEKLQDLKKHVMKTRFNAYAVCLICHGFTYFWQFASTMYFL